jgi:NADH-quinone oxidoreductase subunit K
MFNINNILLNFNEIYKNSADIWISLLNFKFNKPNIYTIFNLDFLNYTIENSKLNSFLALTFLVYILFIIALYGLLKNTDNLLKYLFCFELALLAGSLSFLFGSLLNNNATGQIYALFILAIAASDTAIGLGIIILNYKITNTIELLKKAEKVNNLLK